MCKDVIHRIRFDQTAQHLHLKDSWGVLFYFHIMSFTLDTIDVKQKSNGLLHLKYGNLQYNILHKLIMVAMHTSTDCVKLHNGVI